MRMPDPMYIDATDAMKNITVEVRVVVRNWWRVRLGAALIRLGGWVAGCHVEVIDGSPE